MATGIVSSPGIGSGLDVNSIVSKLMAVEQQPLTALDTKEASFQAQLSALGTLKGALSSFRDSLTQLASPNTFQALLATPGDTSVLTGTASGSAAIGTYSVQVSQLAQAQALAANGQATTTASIGSGAATTISFQFGSISGGTLTNGAYSGATFTQDASQPGGQVVINSSNNSLAGIRDAINNANLGVTASIVGDGSANPYRLVLQSSSSGAARAMRISVSGDAALQNLLSYDPGAAQNLTQTQAAQDAKFSINGLSLSNATNSVTAALAGVTLNLLSAGSSSLSVKRDTSGVQTALQGMVKAYNDLNSQLTQVASYNPDTQQAGPLNGDFAVTMIQSHLRDALSKVLDGGLAYHSLADIGVSFQRDGTLSLDTSALTTALQSNADAVAGLLSTFGTATDSLVSYVGQTAATRAGVYAVNINAIATQGRVQGSAPANLTITSGANDQLAVSIDGVAASISLAAGTYTAAGLATMVQSSINGASALKSAGVGVTVTESGGTLTISSNRYGSASSVSLSGSGASAVLGNAPIATAGTDVSGTINGDAATGSGQTLTASTGAANGLKLTIAGGSSGDRGTVTVTRGLISPLTGLLDDMVGSTGVIASRTDGINLTIKDIGNQRDALNLRLADIEQRYRTQFTTLDTLLSSMQSTSSFLTQQLARLPSTSTTG